MWYFIFLATIYAASIFQCIGTKFYMDFEHPNVTYWNPKYYSYINLTAQRRNRRDPIHYVSIHSNCLVDCGNEISVDAYVYELMSNEFRRGFLEVHYKLCDWMKMEKTFLPFILKFFPIKTCPFPKGEYHFVDMSLPDMPLLRTFPFSKGRFFINVSNWRTSERVLDVYIDIFIKEELDGRKLVHRDSRLI